MVSHDGAFQEHRCFWALFKDPVVAAWREWNLNSWPSDHYHWVTTAQMVQINILACSKIWLIFFLGSVFSVEKNKNAACCMKIEKMWCLSTRQIWSFSENAKTISKTKTNAKKSNVMTKRHEQNKYLLKLFSYSKFLRKDSTWIKVFSFRNISTRFSLMLVLSKRDFVWSSYYCYKTFFWQLCV